jgi:glycosyltransferase involved in cell wall biosynthesis
MKKNIEQLNVNYRKNGEKIVVALPAHNEEDYIAKVIVGCQLLVDEVIVVDDGSNDATAHIAKSLGAIVVSHDTNRGYGAAISTCFKTAKERNADIMVILDADGQHDPKDVIRLIECMENGSDIVIGSRFISNNGRNVPAYRKIGIKILNLATILAGSEKVSDSQSGFRAYSRRAIENIRLDGDGMSAGSEILLQAKEQGLKISDVSIVCRYDQGESSQNPISHGLCVLIDICIRSVYKRPLLYFLSIGVIFLILGSGIGMWSFQMYINTGSLPFGPSIAMLLFLILGSLLVFSGLILHNMGRMVKEITNINKK